MELKLKNNNTFKLMLSNSSSGSRTMSRVTSTLNYCALEAIITEIKYVFCDFWERWNMLDHVLCSVFLICIGATWQSRPQVPYWQEKSFRNYQIWRKSCILSTFPGIIVTWQHVTLHCGHDWIITASLLQAYLITYIQNLTYRNESNRHINSNYANPLYYLDVQ